jgi:hypothetical protein
MGLVDYLLCKSGLYVNPTLFHNNKVCPMEILGWWQHHKTLFKGYDLLCVWFCMKVIPLWVNYICVEWVLWSRMKRILGALLIEVSILNYVIWRDPFCGQFVEPCSDFNILVLISGTLVYPFLNCWLYLFWLLWHCASSTLLRASYVITVEFLLRKGFWNDPCVLKIIDANEHPGSEISSLEFWK